MVLNLLGLDYVKMPFVVDKNPRLQGRFIPMTGNEIIQPNELANLQTKTIHVLNYLYLREINLECERLGIRAEVGPLFNS